MRTHVAMMLRSASLDHVRRGLVGWQMPHPELGAFGPSTAERRIELLERDRPLAQEMVKNPVQTGPAAYQG